MFIVRRLSAAASSWPRISKLRWWPRRTAPRGPPCLHLFTGAVTGEKVTATCPAARSTTRQTATRPSTRTTSTATFPAQPASCRCMARCATRGARRTSASSAGRSSPTPSRHGRRSGCPSSPLRPSTTTTSSISTRTTSAPRTSTHWRRRGMNTTTITERAIAEVEHQGAGPRLVLPGYGEVRRRGDRGHHRLRFPEGRRRNNDAQPPQQAGGSDGTTTLTTRADFDAFRERMCGHH